MCWWAPHHPVFSAHAEVVPYDWFIGFNELCILRARGGSSGKTHLTRL